MLVTDYRLSSEFTIGVDSAIVRVLCGISSARSKPPATFCLGYTRNRAVGEVAAKSRRSTVSNKANYTMLPIYRCMDVIIMKYLTN